MDKKGSTEGGMVEKSVVQGTYVDMYRYVISKPGGGFNPSEKMLVNLDHFPKDRGENNKYLKPPAR